MGDDHQVRKSMHVEGHGKGIAFIFNAETPRLTTDSFVRSFVRSVHFSFSQKRVNDEIQQLLMDIRRIGGDDSVKFGQLFDDEDVQQYYEALVGTLKSAKKRGVIDFKGQMLLKGMHDHVVITIQEN